MGSEDIKGNTTITRVRGAKISRKKRKYPDWGGVHSSEGEVGRQRGEKGMDTRGRSAWRRRTWSRVDQHQTVCQSQMGGQQDKVLVSMEGKV